MAVVIWLAVAALFALRGWLRLRRRARRGGGVSPSRRDGTLLGSLAWPLAIFSRSGPSRPRA